MLFVLRELVFLILSKYSHFEFKIDFVLNTKEKTNSIISGNRTRGHFYII